MSAWVAESKVACSVVFLISVCSLASFSTPAPADPTDCVGDAPDGRAICFQRQPAPIQVDPCEDGADQTTHQRAWCQAGGGSYAGQFADPQCPKFTPYNEEDISQRSASFGLNLTNAPCAVVSDTGWNATYAGTNFCNGGTGRVLQDGYMVRDTRRIILSCGQDVRWTRATSVSCPQGSKPKTVQRGG